MCRVRPHSPSWWKAGLGKRVGLGSFALVVSFVSVSAAFVTALVCGATVAHAVPKRSTSVRKTYTESAASAANPEPAPTAAAPEAAPRAALSPLPKPPSLELPPPSTASAEALDEHLAHLLSRDAAERETAVQEIAEVEPDRLAAIHRKLVAIADSSDHVAMKDLLGSIRDKSREEAGKKSYPDYLAMLSSHAKPDSKPWRDLVSVLSMSRMLRQIATVGAARELIGVYVRFGDFLRVDTQLSLEKLGDRAVAALIEAGRHPAPKIAHWAARQLDMLGKAIPGEAVQTPDPEVLSDILRAYGRVRDPDSARLVISFANSERTQIRDAARQSVALMGEVANWQLRDTYENVVGKKPPREWSWERTARELFTEYDRLRLSQVQVLFEQGLAAYRAGKLEDMAAAFDQVLAQSPVFERASEMVPGYLAYARSHLDDSQDKAARALQRTLRLSTPGDQAATAAESLLLTLQAEDLLTHHVADQTLGRRALELDPTNARARRFVDTITHGNTTVERGSDRYYAAGAIGAVALLALGFIVLRRKPSAPSATPPGEEAVPTQAEPVVAEPEPAVAEPEPAVAEPEPAVGEPHHDTPQTKEPDPSEPGS